MKKLLEVRVKLQLSQLNTLNIKTLNPQYNLKKSLRKMVTGVIKCQFHEPKEPNYSTNLDIFINYVLLSTILSIFLKTA